MLSIFSVDTNANEFTERWHDRTQKSPTLWQATVPATYLVCAFQVKAAVWYLLNLRLR